jgi:hypothetical protein
MPAFSLLIRPRRLSPPLLPLQDAPLPLHSLRYKVRGFGKRLKARYIFGATPLDQ